jgi:hypothetical protein
MSLDGLLGQPAVANACESRGREISYGPLGGEMQYVAQGKLHQRAVITSSQLCHFGAISVD